MNVLRLSGARLVLGDAALQLRPGGRVHVVEQILAQKLACQVFLCTRRQLAGLGEEGAGVHGEIVPEKEEGTGERDEGRLAGVRYQ